MQIDGPRLTLGKAAEVEVKAMEVWCKSVCFRLLYYPKLFK